MMTLETVAAAKIRAQEFITRAAELERFMKTLDQQPNVGIAGSSLTSALRRQSMELTRALAEMRKP